MENNTNINIETVIAEAKADLAEKNFTSIKVEHTDWDNTIRARLNSNNHRKSSGYGPSMAQVKYLQSFDNINHWDAASGQASWYSHNQILGCSKAAISWLISFAKSHRDIDIDLVIEK